MKIIPIIASTFLAFGALADNANAALTLSNWTITPDTLSFSISGNFQASAQPATNRGTIWIAAVGNGSWITNDTNPNRVVTGTIDGVDVGATFPTVFSFTGNGSTNIGLYLDLGSDEPGEPGIEFNFTDGLNNEINIHVELTSIGKYNPGNIDPADLELYWGGNAFVSDVNSAVALGLNVIPEPSTALLGALGALGLLRRRRA